MLDQFLVKNDIDLTKVKFSKIDIEGYDYIALLGAFDVLGHIKFLISEFAPEHMKKGGVEPSALINLLEKKSFNSNVIRDGQLHALSSNH